MAIGEVSVVTRCLLGSCKCTSTPHLQPPTHSCTIYLRIPRRRGLKSPKLVCFCCWGGRGQSCSLLNYIWRWKEGWGADADLDKLIFGHLVAYHGHPDEGNVGVMSKMGGGGRRRCADLDEQIVDQVVAGHEQLTWTAVMVWKRMGFGGVSKNADLDEQVVGQVVAGHGHPGLQCGHGGGAGPVASPQHLPHHLLHRPQVQVREGPWGRGGARHVIVRLPECG